MNSPLCVPVTRTRNCLVAARYHVFDVHPEVRERCERHLEVLDHARLGWRNSRYFVALDEIISELSPETVDVTSVDEIVKALYGNSVIHDFLLRNGYSSIFGAIRSGSHRTDGHRLFEMMLFFA
jgi:hypothetical protein